MSTCFSTWTSVTSLSPLNRYHDYPIIVQQLEVIVLAPVLSGFSGVVQDWTYSKYIRPSLSSPKQIGVIITLLYVATSGHSDR